MKRCAYLSAFLLFTISLIAQQAKPADFAGTWDAEFHKKVWLVLTLEDSKNGLTGALEHSVQISADDEGDITRVDDEMSTDKIVKTELEDSVLTIRTRDDEGNADAYRLVLTGANSAELQSVVNENSSAPKPFKLKRAAPSTPK
ncbi:MAG TPA: hypothetical protein VGL89_15175 [Candidatus Koribacter sp.]|jgi:hypothetical protein